MWHYILLLICAAAIYVSSEWFVNAVEWLGRRLNVQRMAVGTILAAFGTALPESVVTLVAVTTGANANARNIGVGAAMGGPLALSTVAYGVTGLAILLRRRKAARDEHAGAARTAGGGAARNADSGEVLPDPADSGRLARDQRWFAAVFVVKVSLGLVAFAYKPLLGFAFFAVYAVYFRREIRRDPHADTSAEDDELEPLKLQRHAADPATWAVVTQTAVTLAVVFVASQIFVRQLDAIGPMLGLPSAVTALLLSIATELPEVMNAIIWVRQGKTGLALANISGSMMIQATIPSGLGLLFTSWRFDTALLWSGIVTLVAICYLLATLRAHRLTPPRLAVSGLFYIAFAIGLVFILL